MEQSESAILEGDREWEVQAEFWFSFSFTHLISSDDGQNI